MIVRCICGHNWSDHHYGPRREMENQSELTSHPKETRIYCKICKCPKFQKKHFWKKNLKFPLKEKFSDSK